MTPIDYTPEPRKKLNLVIPKKNNLELIVCPLFSGCPVAKTSGRDCGKGHEDCQAYKFYQRFDYLDILNNINEATKDSGMFI